MRKIIIPVSPEMRTALTQLDSARKKLRSAQEAHQPTGGPGELEDSQRPPAQGGQDKKSPRRGEKALTTGIAAGTRDVEGLGDKSGVSAFTSRRKQKDR